MVIHDWVSLAGGYGPGKEKLFGRGVWGEVGKPDEDKVDLPEQDKRN